MVWGDGAHGRHGSKKVSCLGPQVACWNESLIWCAQNERVPSSILSTHVWPTTSPLHHPQIRGFNPSHMPILGYPWSTSHGVWMISQLMLKLSACPKKVLRNSPVQIPQNRVFCMFLCVFSASWPWPQPRTFISSSSACRFRSDSASCSCSWGSSTCDSCRNWPGFQHDFWKLLPHDLNLNLLCQWS